MSCPSDDLSSLGLIELDCAIISSEFSWDVVSGGDDPPSPSLRNLNAVIPTAHGEFQMKFAFHTLFAVSSTAKTRVPWFTGKRCNWAIILTGLTVIALFSAELQAASPTTTTLTIEPAEHLSSLEPVVLTATVVSQGLPVSPGIVTFCDASAHFCEDQAVLGTAGLMANGTAFIKMVFSPGVHRVYALFNMTQTDAGSRSEPQTFKVGPRIPTTTVLSKASTDDTDSVRATITSAGTPPITGRVALVDDGERRRMLAEIKHSELTSSFAPLSSYISAPVPYEPIGIPGALTIGDFDADGLMDVAVGVTSGEADGEFAGIAFFLNDPAHPGQFVPGTTLYVAGLDVNLIAADFNNDGLTDLAFQCLGIGTVQECVYLNDPSNPGQFIGSVFTTAASFGQAVDMNQDGILDLVGSNGAGIDIIFGDPAHPGQFINETSFPDPNIYSVSVADVNGDGIPDVVVSEDGENSTISVFLGDPHNPGKLLPPVRYPMGTFADPFGIVIADFNHDGLPDIATVLYSGVVDVLLNRPDAPGQFSAPVSYPGGPIPFSLTVGNFQGTDSLDIVVNGYNGLYILPADPFHPGEFLSPVYYPLNASGLAVADFNVDGLDDLGIIYLTSDQSTFDLGMLLSQPIQTATIDFSAPSYQRSESTVVHADYFGDLTYEPSRSCPIDFNTGAAAAPVINDLGAHNIWRTSTDITWWGNASTSTVAYGTTTALGRSAVLSHQHSGPYQLWEEISLVGLKPATKYYYQLASTLAVPDCPTTMSTSPVMSFTTAR
jgi:hypothetical protein